MMPIIKDMDKEIAKCSENAKIYFLGYDASMEDALNFLDNLDVYPELETIFEEGVADVSLDKAERVKEALKDWLFMQKNENLVSVLDNEEVEAEYMTWKDIAEAESEEE